MSVADNIKIIQERIFNSEMIAGCSHASVRLMAVSKFNPAESVLRVIDAGISLFGENRVQEAGDKFPVILNSRPAVELHLIGSLQRNKVRQIVNLASCIQSVDRPELLGEIEKQAGSAGLTMGILFEFHTGEETKSGYQKADDLYRSIDSLERMPHVRCEGLMTMAPFTEDREAVRLSFRRLASLQKECRQRYPSLGFDVLSMGMSADYEIAIEEGSTLVRIGRAIFGERL
jgi:pyridoxal phosphate enzyme (YggS family)